MKGWFNEPIKHALASKGIPTAFGRSKVAKFKQQMQEKPQEDLILTKDEYDEYYLEKLIQLFWWSSINDNWDYINLDKSLEVVEDILEKKLGEHFYLPPEKQKKFLMEHYNEQLEQKHTVEEIFPREGDIFLRIYMMKHPEKADEIFEKFMTEEDKERIEEIKDKYDLRKRTFGGDLKGNWYEEYLHNEINILMSEDEDFRERFFETLAQVDIHPDDFERYDEEVYDNIKGFWNAVRNKDKLSREEKIQVFDRAIDLVHHNGKVFEQFIQPYQSLDKLREDFEEVYT